MARTQYGKSVGKRALAGAFVLSMATGGCGQLGDDVDGFSSADWTLITQIQPLSTPMPRNPFNHKDQDVAVAKLGQKLFYDTGYAEAITADPPVGTTPSGAKGEVGKVGCITCHDPDRAFADKRPGPTSHGRSALRRNTPTMVNLGWYEWFGWAGRHDSMVMHGAGVMGVSGTPLRYAHFIYEKYRDEYNAAFPETPLDPALDPEAPDANRFPPSGGPKANAMAPDGPWEMMSAADRKAIQQIQANMGRVWDTYPRMLVMKNSPFERYVRDRNFGTLTPRQKNGLRLFIGKAACNDCHNGPILSDNKFHNIGVSDPPGATAMDMGRFADMPATLTNAFNGVGEYSDDKEAGMRKHQAINPMDESMKGAFRTPMLLNIELTAPYFHTGRAATLEDVILHYNNGGGQAGSHAGEKSPRLRPLGLTESEVADLVAFLKSLTGEPADPDWVRDIR